MNELKWNGIEWNEMNECLNEWMKEWNETRWNRMKWNRMKWNEMNKKNICNKWMNELINERNTWMNE